MAVRPLEIDSIKPNSHAYREKQRAEENGSTEPEREKLPPVVKKDGVVSTKKSLGQKFVDAFISDDAKDVKSYIMLDVIIPTIKNTILDVIEMIFFGNMNYRDSHSSRLSSRDRVSYSSVYKSEYNGRRSSSRREEPEYQENVKVDYRNIILRERRDAENVVNSMRERIAVYRQASIADLFDLIDVTSNYVDNNWGWTDERDIGIRRVSNGYLIDVREAEYLD